MTSLKGQEPLATVVAVSDSAYLHHLTALGNSLRVNWPQAAVVVCLVNVSVEETASLRQVFPDWELRELHLAFDNDEDRRGFCANCRVALLRDLLHEGRDHLVYLDADSLVRGPLDDLLADMASCDVLILHRLDSTEEQTRFATGVIGIRRTGSAIRFLNRWADLVATRPCAWFSDQLFFSRARDELGSTVRTKDLPPQFIDWQFHPMSPVWVGKGERKHDKMLYRLEEEYYLSTPGMIRTVLHRVRMKALFLSRGLLMLTRLSPASMKTD